MRRKFLTYEINRVIFLIVTGAMFLYAANLHLCGVEAPDTEAGLSNFAPKYVGAASCASSGCHGGGGRDQNQFLVWSLRDFHAQRPFATLTAARSRQIADALQIKDPTSDARCTSCHAPLHGVPAALRTESLRVSEGVSCESCHGPAENWMRSHTRPDYSYTDRVTAGMRDLKNLYVRANTCIACHQTVAQPLLRAGHPELIFELDGQCVSQPKHWREKTNWHGAQAWLVGQAAALREMCWQLAIPRLRDHDREKLAARADALFWLLHKLEVARRSVPNLATLGIDPPSTVPPDYTQLHSAADKLARSAAEINWSSEITSAVLAALAGTSADFGTQLPAHQQALRAERLVLALDRLFASTPQPSADARLSDLFKLTQSLPDFNSARFRATLADFAATLNR